MKLLKSGFCIVIFLAFIIQATAFAGTLHIWTDENGVTHMTSQPPPENVKHEKMGYKNPTTKRRTRTKKSNYNQNYLLKQQEIERDYNIRKRGLEEKYEKRNQEFQRKLQKIKLDSAKRMNDHHEKWKETYRKYYHNADNKADREYWYRKMKEANEAENEYFKLKGKYRE